MAKKTVKKISPKKTATKKTVARTKSSTPHLLRDHPNLKWLLLVFLLIAVFVFWKTEQNQKMVQEAIIQEGMPVEMVEVDVETSEMVPQY